MNGLEMQAKSKKKKQADPDSEGEFSDAESDEDFAPKKVGFIMLLSMTLLILVCVIGHLHTQISSGSSCEIRPQGNLLWF